MEKKITENKKQTPKKRQVKNDPQAVEKTKNSLPLTSSKKIRNREFAVITYMFFGIFLLMMGYFIYFQIVRSEDFINSPYNKRQETFKERIVRGEIRSSDGQVLAQTITEEDGTETRYYPYGAMFAHVVGYEEQGKTGIESFANFNLLRSNANILEQIMNELQGKKNPGDTVVTTLNYELQETLYQAIGEKRGAAIVIEPSTGKILAMVSKPDFNPNTISLEWEKIIEDEENSVLLNRVTQGLYPPGSTFKIFTTLAYIREQDTYKDYSYECKGSIEMAGNKISCAGGTVHGEEDLMTSFAKSCNTSYANIGLSLDKNEFAKMCNALLFDTEMPTSYASKKSRFTLTDNSPKALVMQTSIGQGETLMTPFHLALVTCAIANDGVLMKPYVVDHTENNNKKIVKQYQPSIYSSLINQNESKILQDFMRNVVTDGTAGSLSNDQYTAGGKTGSAEYGSTKGKSHAWFTGYAYDGAGNDMVITVIVEEGGSGSATAVPIAKEVMDTYFSKIQ